MPDINLAHAMSLPPQDAVAYFQRKGYAITWDWQELWQEAQAQAFTVAKVTRLDILQDIRDALQKVLTEGKTAAWFAQELTPVLQAKGWWGRKEHVDAETGEVSKVQLGSPWRLQTIFRANVQTAYMAGRFQRQLENVDDRPYWKYVAILDSRTRPSHRALNGKVFRYDDPFWSSFYPPNGWGCRCRVVALSADDIEVRGIIVDSSEGKLGAAMRLLSEKTGEMREVTTYTTAHPDDPTGKRKIVISPDVGWSYNPGAAAWAPDIKRYVGELATLAEKELAGAV